MKKIPKQDKKQSQPVVTHGYFPAIPAQEQPPSGARNKREQRKFRNETTHDQIQVLVPEIQSKLAFASISWSSQWKQALRPIG